MMRHIGKTYTLKNGNKITKAALYDGFEDRVFWVVYFKDGKFKGNIGSYEEAYKIATAKEVK